MDNDDTSVHAGCVAGPAADVAGCADAAGDEGQTAATPTAEPASAGCVVARASDDVSTKATPPQTLREFERALRDMGFTRLQANHIARQGFSGANSAPEVEPVEIAQLRQALSGIRAIPESSS